MKLAQILVIGMMTFSAAALITGCAPTVEPVTQEAAGICQDACADTEATCLFQCELDDAASTSCFDKCETDHDVCANTCGE